MAQALWPAVAGFARPSRSAAAFIAGLATIMLTLCAVVGWALTETWTLGQRRAEEALANISLGVERTLTRDLLGFDLLLHNKASGGSGVSGAELVRPWSSVPPEMLGGFYLLDASGKLVGPEGPEEAHRPWLQRSLEAHRLNPGLGLLAGDIGVGTHSLVPRLVLSRRREDAQGRFAGIVAGSIRLRYFVQAFERFRLGAGSAITLLTTDGRLVASSAMGSGSEGRDLKASPEMQYLRLNGPGTFTARSVVDGRERLYNASRLDKLPFYLVVGQLTSDIHAEWNLRATAAAVLLLGLSPVLGIMALTLHRELGRRRLAELQARASAAELETVTGNADDLILKLDWSGTRHFVSSASEQLLGYAPSELLGRNSLQYVHPDDQPSLNQLLAELHANMTDQAVISYRIQHRRGEWRHVEARCRALPDGSGAIIAVRDRTEQVRLEEKLRQSQKMEAVGQLTAGVAHDFNNMLQGQIAGLELLLDEVAGQKVATKLTERAIQAGERGARLTHSLLAFSRQQVLQPEAVDVTALLDDLAGLLSRTLGPLVSLEVAIDPRLPRPLADRTQLQSALLNLCLNARDAMLQTGGHIKISAYADTEMSVQAGKRQPRSMVLLSVSDDGPGMTKELLARACEPFFTTKRLGEGSGLGLSMVQGFARQSGGELHLHSIPGQGTCAQIRLPTAPPQDETATGPAAGRSTPAAAAADGRILLVDDDFEVLSNLVGTLEQAGFQVISAESGAEAAEVLRARGDIDVLVTDFGMPGMTGAALAQLAQTLHPRMPILIITGYVDGRLLESIPANVGLLHKPFRLESLIERINAIREISLAA